MPSTPNTDRQETRPGFLVIGAQKCGTSWLHRHLSAHPDLWMPPGKELEFFSYTPHLADPGLDAYHAAFAPAGDRLAGEATASYFWTGSDSPWCRLPAGFEPDIPASVRRHLDPQLKLIVSLRDPVERALSAWAHYVAHRELDPELGFRDAAPYGGIVDMGFYGRHLARWRAHFPARQMLVLGLENDIVREPGRTLRRCFGFLDVRDISLNDELLAEPVFAGPRRTLDEDGGMTIFLPDRTRLSIGADDVAWLRGLYEADRERLLRLVGPAFRADWPRRREGVGDG